MNRVTSRLAALLSYTVEEDGARAGSSGKQGLAAGVCFVCRNGQHGRDEAEGRPRHAEDGAWHPLLEKDSHLAHALFIEHHHRQQSHADGLNDRRAPTKPPHGKEQSNSLELGHGVLVELLEQLQLTRCLCNIDGGGFGDFGSWRGHLNH